MPLTKILFETKKDFENFDPNKTIVVDTQGDSYYLDEIKKLSSQEREQNKDLSFFVKGNPIKSVSLKDLTEVDYPKLIINLALINEAKDQNSFIPDCPIKVIPCLFPHITPVANASYYKDSLEQLFLNNNQLAPDPTNRELFSKEHILPNSALQSFLKCRLQFYTVDTNDIKEINKTITALQSLKKSLHDSTIREKLIEQMKTIVKLEDELDKAWMKSAFKFGGAVIIPAAVLTIIPAFFPHATFSQLLIFSATGAGIGTLAGILVTCISSTSDAIDWKLIDKKQEFLKTKNSDKDYPIIEKYIQQINTLIRDLTTVKNKLENQERNQLSPITQNQSASSCPPFNFLFNRRSSHSLLSEETKKDEAIELRIEM